MNKLAQLEALISNTEDKEALSLIHEILKEIKEEMKSISDKVDGLDDYTWGIGNYCNYNKD